MSSQDTQPARVPRPANAFMCFRSLYVQEQKATAQPAARQTDYSRRAAQLWNSMSDKERRPYKDIADRIQAEHNALHPDYRYIRNSRDSGTGSRGGSGSGKARRRRAQPPTQRTRQQTSSSQTSGTHNIRIPTLSSAYALPPPPLDGGDHAHPNFSRDSASTAGARNQKPLSSCSRTEHVIPSDWDPTASQFGLPRADVDDAPFASASQYYSPDLLRSLVMRDSDSARTSSMPCDLPHPASEQDFGALCEWNSDFSRSNTQNSACGTVAHY